MARTDSPDFDLSDALFMEHEAGREAGKREAKASQAAKTRKATTEHKRQLEREESRRKTGTQRSRRETTKRKGQLAREQEQTRRATTVESQRTAREYQRQQARERQQAAQNREARRRSRQSGGGGGGGGFPTVGTSGVQMSTTTARNIVLACIVGSALAVSFRSAKTTAGLPQAVTLKSGQTVRVPANLRSLGGVMLAGTAALIFTEFNPPLGVVFGVLLLLDSGFGTALGSFTSNFFNGAKPQPYIPNQGTGGASNLPSGNSPPPGGGIWLPGGNPGKQPGSGPAGGPIEVPYGSPSG